MKHGIILGATADDKAIHIQVHRDDKRNFVPIAKTGMQKKFALEIHCQGILESTESPGIMVFKSEGYPEVYVRDNHPRRTLAQNATLRGIERFIATVQNGGRRPDEEQLYWIHEGLVEEYSVETWNPYKKRTEMMRTSDPKMNTQIMAKVIEGALNMLASEEIPDDVMKVIGEDMHQLWKQWYKWRYSQKIDPLLEWQPKTWAEYQEAHPVCEICGHKGTDDNPLERMHIISAGADETVYEEWWNWLHSHRSHHSEQHNYGWTELLKKYPHIEGKVKTARDYWHAAKQGVLIGDST